MKHPAPHALLATLVLTAVTAAQGIPDKIFGLKSCGSSPPICGTVPSAVPVHLYSFLPDGSAFVDHGPVTLAGAQVDLDGLAMSPAHGLLGFRLERGIQNQYAASYLVVVDPHTAVVHPRGLRLDREIRGACFDGRDELWVLDARRSELLRVDPASGAEVGVPIALREGGRPFSLSDICDLAIAGDGTFHITARNDIYTVDLATGDLRSILTDTGHGNAGAVFATAAGPRILITFDVNYIDDLLRYDLGAPNPGATVLLSNIIPLFNAGRGDLAALPNDRILASCTFRDGGGVNPAEYRCVSRPAVGTVWRTEIATTPNTVSTFLAVAVLPDPGIPLFGGEVLIGLAPAPSIVANGLGSHALSIPNQAALVGATAATQGFRIDGRGPTTVLVLLNAEDLRFGV
jgi:hypothetical protein